MEKDKSNPAAGRKVEITLKTRSFFQRFLQIPAMIRVSWKAAKKTSIRNRFYVCYVNVKILLK